MNRFVHVLDRDGLVAQMAQHAVKERKVRSRPAEQDPVILKSKLDAVARLETDGLADRLRNRYLAPARERGCRRRSAQLLSVAGRC